MRFLHYLILFLLIGPSLSSAAQNSYNLKKEYGFKGELKKVISYMVDVGRYHIPVDTLNYYGKNTMYFSRKGDLQQYDQMLNLPNYHFISKAKYKGNGKQVSFTEEVVLNGEHVEISEYFFKWQDDLRYEIVALNGEGRREVTLNSDFTIKKVDFTWGEYKSEETAKYVYKDGFLEKVVYELTTSENNEVDNTMDVRKVQAHDVYKNPTVIYFYKSEDSRVPTSVLFRYYEYY